MKRDLEMVARSDEFHMANVTNPEPGCMTRDTKGIAARALALLILGTVAGLGGVALFVLWLVYR